MPNARRVRQDAEAAARRYAEYGNLIANYNANIDKMNSGNAAAVALYNQQVADFKAFQKDVEEGRAVAVADIGYGNMFGGYDPFETERKSWPEGKVPLALTEEQQAQQQKYADYVNQKQAELTAQWQAEHPNTGETNNSEYLSIPQYNPIGDPNAPPQVERTFVDEKSPEGIAALKAASPVGQFAIVAGKDGKIIPGDLDEKGFAKDAGFMRDSVAYLGPLPQQIGPIAVGDKQAWVRNGDGTATRYMAGPSGWYAAGPPIKILEWNKEAPVQQTDAGAAPEAPKDWNPSLREKAELENPTVNAAGANMAAAMGSYAKAGLMNEASRQSQSLTNSDTGVLNRVMQGIL